MLIRVQMAKTLILRPNRHRQVFSDLYTYVTCDIFVYSIQIVIQFPIKLLLRMRYTKTCSCNILERLAPENMFIFYKIIAIIIDSIIKVA